jgi:hypothetical protein
MTITLGISAVCAVVGSILFFASPGKWSAWGLSLFTAGAIALLLGMK